MGKTQIAGTAIKGQEVRIDVDGITIKDFAHKSAETAGLSQDDWYKKFNEGMHSYADEKGLKYLDGVTVKDDASMQQAIDSIYANGGTQSQAYNGTLRPLFKSMSGQGTKDNPFLYDPAWQPQTSAEWHPDQWRKLTPEEEKKYAGKTKHNDGSRLVASEEGTWAVKPQKDPIYADPLTQPYVARKGPSGIYKVTNGADPSKFVYAIKGDSPPNNDYAEISPAAANAIGADANPRGSNRATPDYAQIDYLGKGNLSTKNPPTFDEIQKEGKRLEDEAKKKAEEAKKKAEEAKSKGKKKKKTADAGERSGGAVRLVTGDTTIGLGKKQLFAAYAGPGCLHEGGGQPIVGSETVCVGRGQYPFARVTDSTNDNLMLNTGENTVLIG